MRADASRRQANYDLLRIISTFAVIFIHVNWRFFGFIYDKPEMNSVWIIESLVNIVTRFSVPCFIMMSGAFILQNEKNGNIVYFYKKSLLKIFIPAFGAVIILAFIRVCLNACSEGELFDGLKGIASGNFYNMWYIYTLAGIYFLVPYLIILKKKTTIEQYSALAWVMLIWAVISQTTSNQRLAYSIGVVFAFLGYFMVGDVLRDRIEKKGCNSKWLLVISFICVLISYIFRFYGFNHYIMKPYISFFSPTIVVYSICVFSLFAKLHLQWDFSQLASITFEIYLFHAMVLQVFGNIIDHYNFRPLFSELILFVVTFVMSCIIAILYKQIYTILVPVICKKLAVGVRTIIGPDMKL